MLPSNKFTTHCIKKGGQFFAFENMQCKCNDIRQLPLNQHDDDDDSEEIQLADLSTISRYNNEIYFFISQS